MIITMTQSFRRITDVPIYKILKMECSYLGGTGHCMLMKLAAHGQISHLDATL